MANLKDRVENSLREIRYHPDFANEAEHELKSMIERLNQAGSYELMKSEVYSYAYDAILMREKFFRGRLEFLSRLITLLGERPEKKLEVAEDGCGSGIDLHVVNTLLTDKVSLTGIDKNPASLVRARKRVPNAKLFPDFNNDTYDVIYADFVHIDDNFIWEIAARGERNFSSLRSPGIVLQNVDMRNLDLYIDYFRCQFSQVIPPELLAKIDSGPDCYLCRFEKE